MVRYTRPRAARFHPGGRTGPADPSGRCRGGRSASPRAGETRMRAVAYHSTNAIVGKDGGEVHMRDTAPAVLTGLVLGWLAKDAWPIVEPILAALGIT